ncbi:protein tramtrack, beta isoform-like [Pollicipes pollicipes]|uniref:protein tramtrack, beta isoform-like n=1 Tax=Pollicipes pollicipes TaxID=41117 RepID=UPI0018858DBA|nr:protein tramtrack, beta isoform-like [Pollicipes pollicipes]
MAAVPQKFCLKWNDFQSIVISMFDNLRHDEELVDVTLCCDGKKIKAHRMVLSACSTYFKEVLKENPCHHPVFFMRDIPYADLSSLIEFIYTGEVNVSQTDLSSFLKTAEMLKVKGLTDNDKTTDVPPCSAPPPQAQAGSRPSGQPAVADRRSAAGGQGREATCPGRRAGGVRIPVGSAGARVQAESRRPATLPDRPAGGVRVAWPASRRTGACRAGRVVPGGAVRRPGGAGGTV